MDKCCRFPDPLVDLLVGELHIGGAEGDILINGLLKQLILRILEYQSHFKADVMSELFGLIDVGAIQRNRSGCRFQQTVKMLNKRGLAGTGMTNNPHQLSFRKREVDIMYSYFFKRSSLTVCVCQRLHFDN